MMETFGESSGKDLAGYFSKGVLKGNGPEIGEQFTALCLYKV